jgi:hypothetical protein
VASRLETSIRCDAIVLDLYTPNYDTGVVAALDLDFFDPITVLTTQPGGSTIEKTLQIFGVSNTYHTKLFPHSIHNAGKCHRWVYTRQRTGSR